MVEHFYGADVVFHFSANADVRRGEPPQRDLEQNTIVTSRILDSCKQANVRRFVFSSTGSIYGEAEQIYSRGCLLSNPDISVRRFKVSVRE